GCLMSWFSSLVLGCRVKLKIKNAKLKMTGGCFKSTRLPPGSRFLILHFLGRPNASLLAVEVSGRFRSMKKANDILLAEDYEPDARLLRILLKRNKVANEIQVVSDGIAALDYLFRRGAYRGLEPNELPGAVLLDIRLPKLDGWE